MGTGLLVLGKPRPRAEREGDALVLAVAPWRRATGVLLFPTLGTVFLLTVPLPHVGAVWTALALTAAFAALAQWGLSIRMRVSPRGFSRQHLPPDVLDRTPGARDLLAFQASPVEGMPRGS